MQFVFYGENCLPRFMRGKGMVSLKAERPPDSAFVLWGGRSSASSQENLLQGCYCAAIEITCIGL